MSIEEKEKYLETINRLNFINNKIVELGKSIRNMETSMSKSLTINNEIYNKDGFVKIKDTLSQSNKNIKENIIPSLNKIIDEL